MTQHASRSQRLMKRVVPAIAVLGLAVGCANEISGHPVSIYADPFTVAGLPATGGPSGPREGVATASLDIENVTDSEPDVLATNAIADIEAYWGEAFPKLFGKDFAPVDTLVSWDSNAGKSDSVEFCGHSSFEVVNAGFCPLDNSLGWDRGTLLPALIDGFGPMATVTVMAHEYGHAVQYLAELNSDSTPTIVLEQQADCFAGGFMRHVAEDKSEHFSLNTSDGLNSVLAAMVAFRDSDPNDPDNVHGSAFERVTAFQFGFTDGPAACTKIDENEVQTRRGDLPQMFDDSDINGEWPVSEESVTTTLDSLQTVFQLPDVPTSDFSTADLGCPDARPTDPVSYCPATNTIGIDLPGLKDRGSPTEDDGHGIQMSIKGDFNAYVLVASRFTLAVQKNAGQPLDEARTAVRAACYAGAWTAATAKGQAGGLQLSPGDLDEAVSGLLTDGLVASDVNGLTVPSGFARVDAFRSGVLSGDKACIARYS